MIVKPVGSRDKVGEYFQAREFDCRCGRCLETRIDPELIKRLDALRRLAGPLIITSGFRCAAHQAALRGRGFETARGTSQHELGRAADLVSRRYAPVELEALARQVGFTAVGLAPTFIHVDLRPQRIAWAYAKARSKV
jgi:uncharacterized protein YcbK (DUF882 family)